MTATLIAFWLSQTLPRGVTGQLSSILPKTPPGWELSLFPFCQLGSQGMRTEVQLPQVILPQPAQSMGLQVASILFRVL